MADRWAGVMVVMSFILLAGGRVSADELPKLPDLIAQGFQIRTGLGASSVLIQKDKLIFICGLQPTGLGTETTFKSTCYAVK